MHGNNKRGGFTRNNSICPTPEEILLKSVLKNDRRHIIRLVENNPNLLNHIYGSTYNKPILLIACSEEQVEAETVRTLIDCGADLYYSSELDGGWQAIHVAAYNTKSEKLKVIVENVKKLSGDINALVENGGNALHILIRLGNESSEEFVRCAKILVEEGIDVNQGDGDDISPILWAAKKGYKEIIKVILECSQGTPVDLDSHQSRKETARDIIFRKQLYDGILPEKVDVSNESDVNILFKYLGKRNEDAFLSFKDGDIFDLVNAHNGCATLLQVGCEKRLKRVVEHLINKGADPNLTINKNKEVPILIAAENGSYEIFEILLNCPKIRVSKTVLITLLKKLDTKKLPQISHEECYDILLEKIEDNRDLMDLNEVDKSNNSPLHYAVRYSEPENVEKLLQLGASLGSKNNYGVMPIQDMVPEVLERHLDNCVEFDKKEKKFEKEDFSVTFNYTTLIPPTKKDDFSGISFDDSDPETNSNHNTLHEFVAETEVIAYMSKAPEFKHLLKHPVVVSFLFVKWHRIRWLFYTNLAFYIAFFASMVVYIFAWYADLNRSENSTFENVLTNISFGIFLITYIVLIFRELFQITVSPDKYFKNFENYIEIILIFFTGSILFIPNPDDDTRRILSSISILLAAFELVLMVGQHPKLSTNVVMLETVSLNFFKFLLWYSLLIIAFALSFYILFTQTEEEMKNSTKQGEEEEEDFFTDPGKSMFKTIVMLTGEFDAGSLKYDHFPIASKIMFSLFIFMIAIILLNLLNGLAVNDTQQIKNNAELVGHIARAQHIHYVESMLLGNILPRTFIRRIRNFCCCFPKSASSFKISKPLAERACLFPQNVNYRLTVYLNKSGQICLERKRSLLGRYCCHSCAYLYLDKETIKRTNRIIQEKREALKVKNRGGNQLESIENIVEKLVKNAMNKRQDDISSLNKKLDDIIKYISVENNQ